MIQGLLINVNHSPRRSAMQKRDMGNLIVAPKHAGTLDHAEPISPATPWQRLQLGHRADNPRNDDRHRISQDIV